MAWFSESWAATSATETMCSRWRRSLRDLTTLRLSLRDSGSWMISSNWRMPMTMGGRHRGTKARSKARRHGGTQARSKGAGHDSVFHSVPSCLRAFVPLSQRPLDLHILVALEDVALLDVVVADDLHAALHAGADLLGVVLEAFELLEAAVVLDDDVLAGDADEGVALDDAVGDVAAGDGADLADLEDLADLGVAQRSEEHKS